MKVTMHCRALGALALVALLAGAMASPGMSVAASPRVVVDVKPVHALVAGIMEGVGVPRLLIAGGASPHTYNLKPSDARALVAADLVIWVGVALTPALEKPIAMLAKDTRLLTLLDDPALKARDREGAPDPHVWLDPTAAERIVAIVARALIAADPGHAGRFRANAAGLTARLMTLDEDLRTRLAPVASRPYAVFHDAYGRFERRYGLTNNVGAIMPSAGHPPGARRLREIRREVKRTGARCVFAEPQFEPALARAVAGGTGARIATLDPLGSNLAPGPDAYFRLMRDLAHGMSSCLGE